jgi:hypothetical protein
MAQAVARRIGCGGGAGGHCGLWLHWPHPGGSGGHDHATHAVQGRGAASGAVVVADWTLAAGMGRRRMEAASMDLVISLLFPCYLR